MANILLTGGRAPATLELCRTFHQAGHSVYMAESLDGHLSQPSNSIRMNILVPPPRQQPTDFIMALRQIILDKKIDLLVPTCEEIFYISAFIDELPCRVFAESLETLDTLHNKWQFAAKAKEYQLPVPETIKIESSDDIKTAFSKWEGVVIKPLYSRFAARTMVLPTMNQALDVSTYDPRQPMLAQEHIPGREICTYSICHNGRITAHTTYESTYTAGRTGTILLKHIEHGAIDQWVQTFVEATAFTGQIAFDFIEKNNGEIHAIECNPHANGIPAALLSSNPNFASAFIDPKCPLVRPNSEASAMLLAGMILYGLPTAIKKREIGVWLKTCISNHDFLFRWNDPLPALFQFRSLWKYWLLAHRKKLSLLDASMFDIEWNGIHLLP